MDMQQQINQLRDQSVALSEALQREQARTDALLVELNKAKLALRVAFGQQGEQDGQIPGDGEVLIGLIQDVTL